MIYTVTLNPAIDYAVWLDCFLAGETNRSRGEHIAVGGKGINVSIVLKELGVSSVATGFVAGFTGEAIEKAVKEKGVQADFVRLPSGNSRINVKIKGETETEINGAGPEVPLENQLELTRKLAELKMGDFLISAGSCPCGVSKKFYGDILEKLQNRGVRFVVDTTGEALLSTLKYKPFLIKPNLSELEELTGKKLESTEEIFAAAEYLQELGAENVLVSMGGDGAVLLDGTGTRHRVNPIKGKLVNSVGAGDSMVAGFIVGYLEQGDYAYALKLGNAAGAATAFSADLATKEEILKLLNE